jgi:UDP-GlcNAc:undecaprenyl-phosphate GlcNAc-1-phosphate transferase
VLLDLVLITVCYAVYRLRFEGEALEIFSRPSRRRCPSCRLQARGHYAPLPWSGYVRMSDVPAVIRAVVVGTTTSVLAATYLYRFERFSRGVFIIDAVLLLLVILGTRLSFRSMSHAAVLQNSGARRVLICGARERGRLLAREMLANRAWSLKPVGFIDGALPSEQSILGVRVYGTLEELRDVIQRLHVEDVVFSGDVLEPGQRQRARRYAPGWGACSRAGVRDTRAVRGRDGEQRRVTVAVLIVNWNGGDLLSAAWTRSSTNGEALTTSSWSTTAAATIHCSGRSDG